MTKDSDFTMWKIKFTAQIIYSKCHIDEAENAFYRTALYVSNQQRYIDAADPGLLCWIASIWQQFVCARYNLSRR